ncbi:MAG: CBS domain-containing protein [Acidobacteria bacterium]|nr:MAG: CBS domain-containing protein [Acidobacteriota bacterium]
MKIREVMSPNRVCCLPTDSAQRLARTMCDHNIGSVPIVIDQDARKLVGVITDRDLCCSVVADGLDPKATAIEKFMTLNPVTCREGENVENCERLMQEHQIRRIPIVDAEDRVIGIVAQADLALKDKPERVSKTVAEISKTSEPLIAA